MRILISGATGLVGSAVMQHACDIGDEPLRLARPVLSHRDATVGAPQTSIRWDPAAGTLDSGAEGADAMNDLSMLVACGLLEQIAATLSLNQSITVKLTQVLRDNGVLRLPQLRERPVEPRPGADTLTRVDGRLSGTSLGAEIGVPGVIARADSRRKRLAVRVGARKSAKISAFTETTLVTKKVRQEASIRAGVGGGLPGGGAMP
jgi:hypothetical protein